MPALSLDNLSPCQQFQRYFMSSARALITGSCLLLAIAVAGCESIAPGQKLKPADALMQAARMSPDSVGLEVFFVRLPHDDRQSYEAIWREVDETSIAGELRQRLSENGMRAGLLSAQLPTRVQQFLQQYEVIEDELPSDPSETGLQQGSKVNFDKEPQVTMRRLQLRSGRRGEIIASNLKKSAEVLLKEEDGLRGRSYANCQGIFAVKAFPQRDGRATFELVPELHHGEPCQRFSGADGVWRLETAKPRHVFDDLMLKATLTPGEMLLVGSLPNRPGSLGHHFFTEDQSGEQHRKLLFVRLTQTQWDDRFQPADGNTPKD